MKNMSPRNRKLLLKRTRAGNISKKLRKTPLKYNHRKTQKFKPFEVEVWDGTAIEMAVCQNPPSRPPEQICLDENLSRTLTFLQFLKSVMPSAASQNTGDTAWLSRPSHGLPQIREFVDFGHIKTFATAPAVVLAALYDRAKHATGNAPSAIDFPKWSPAAFQTLYEIGFFEIIGHGPAERIKEVYTEKRDTSYMSNVSACGTDLRFS